MRKPIAGCMLAVMLLSAGCGRNDDQADEARGTEQRLQSKQAAQTQGGQNADTQTRLEDLAKSIPQVTDAKCVILGKTAIVGITVDPALERSRVNVIKYSVAEAFRKDPAGINAFVTADMGLGERIRQVREDIRNGKPFSGFAQELGDIIGRVAPQLPRDIQPMDDHRNDDPSSEQFQNNNL
ncbi:YhcN/YlaJ family sporulation lipoprotein [Gorillibacterium sp. sgz5001074]|uniref:YhcN/YlaJ family sporulation lipoprotein n=1 Tax=Gorillibacterium sp. sgz5001074 TaxID=3446695 RepID=UPI003F671633